MQSIIRKIQQAQLLAVYIEAYEKRDDADGSVIQALRISAAVVADVIHWFSL